MKVAIIGGGAVGLLFASYFAEGGAEVTVCVRREEQAKALRENGLTLVYEKERLHTEIEAKVLKSRDLINTDLIIVAVKQYDLSELKDILRTDVGKHAKLLFVQNGMGHVSLMEALPHSTLYVGVVEHGVLKKSDCEIEHTGQGIVKIAAVRGTLEAFASMADKLSSERFPIEYQHDWYQLLARKLLINAVINPLTALYRVENGVLIDDPHFRNNMRRLFDEAFRVLDLEEEQEQWENVQNVCRNTAKNRSSMLRDLEIGRPTEIDAISGFLQQQAKGKGISMPYTTFVYDSILGLSNRQPE